VLLRSILSCLLAGLSAAAGLGQTGRVSVSGQRTQAYTYHLANLRRSPFPGVSTPFSVERVTESVLSASDGTPIPSYESSLLFLDSEGRSRIERPLGPGLGRDAPPLPTLVEIRDPVAGAAYVLDLQGKIAHRVTLPPELPGPKPPAGRLLASRPPRDPRFLTGTQTLPDGSELATEYLGTQTLEGVEAVGKRETRTFPPGLPRPDRVLVVVTETWTSPRLPGVPVLKRSHSTYSGGDTTERLIHLSFAEPPLSSFQPPPDYTVVEETGASISIPIQLQPIGQELPMRSIGP
jgi:hypothetical protein